MQTGHKVPCAAAAGLVPVPLPRLLMLPTRSQLDRLTEPGAFVWATGIEDTFITAPWPATGRTLDEYELTGHYDRWEEDLGLAASLGAPAIRYGIPWHRLQPEPDRWDWDFADRTLGRLLELGVDPIVDLVHYGLPPWLEGAYFHPDYPARVAEYAGKLLERFRGRLRWYTPLNEPRITGWYCGRLGWWPPFARGWRGFAKVMLAVSRGIVETVRAAQSIDPELVACHVDATDLYDTGPNTDAATQTEAATRQELVFLALDLVSGRVREGTPLAAWLRAHGATDADLAWFAERAVDLPVVGMNLYPMFTQKRLYRTPAGRLRIAMTYANGELLTRLGRMYHARYHRPLMVTETASTGSVAKRRRWLEDSVVAVKTLRAEGVPLVGYTWWPMFSLVAWAYRQGKLPASYYLEPMGLWDLAPDDLRRTETPLVAAYRDLCVAGAGAVGRLEAPAAGS